MSFFFIGLGVAIAIGVLIALIVIVSQINLDVLGVIGNRLRTIGGGANVSPTIFVVVGYLLVLMLLWLVLPEFMGWWWRNPRLFGGFQLMLVIGALLYQQANANKNRDRLWLAARIIVGLGLIFALFAFATGKSVPDCFASIRANDPPPAPMHETILVPPARTKYLNCVDWRKEGQGIRSTRLTEYWPSDRSQSYAAKWTDMNGDTYISVFGPNIKPAPEIRPVIGGTVWFVSLENEPVEIIVKR